MVLEANKQFHEINKYLIKFFEESENLSEEQKKSVIDEWRIKSARLKSRLHNNATKTPKRVISKYLFFCEDERPKIREANPDISINKCTCELGEAWRRFKENPDPERMKKYTRLFEEDKQRFEREKVELQNIENVSVKPRKRCESAYLNYCAKRRETEPKISLKNLSIGWSKVKLDPHELALYTNS